jgi:beta-lactamase superfamily II metal-dependent hydrolase
MTCEIAFLPVGNADSIVIRPAGGSAVVIDLHKIPTLLKWFQNKKETNISRIYITHEHRDHFPSLEDLVTFLENWLKRGTVTEICLPYEVFKNAIKRVNSNRAENKRLEDALLRLKKLRKNITFLESTRRSNPYTQGDLEIHVLHPELCYAQEHLESISGRHNEISIVLRVTYGKFAALLLADIEGVGLRECVEICQPHELNANLVKVPHHGAWPKNGDDLRQLLEAIDAEIAVLSVGSTNKYGHVVPELFALLLSLKNDTSKRLKNFVCTEVTRTCVNSASERAEMGKSGLDRQQLCAGEITILAETSGNWNLKTQTNHADEVSHFKCAACDGRADVGEIAI